MVDQKDHDLLIAINAKLTGLCKNFNDLKTDNKNAHQKIWDGINGQNDRKLPSKIFYWVLPFIILGLMGIAGLASSNRYSVGKIEKAIELRYKEVQEQTQEDLNTGDNNAVTESIIIHKQR